MSPYRPRRTFEARTRDQIPDEELWWRHQALKKGLIAYARFQLKQARQDRGEDLAAVRAAEQVLDP